MGGVNLIQCLRRLHLHDHTVFHQEIGDKFSYQIVIVENLNGVLLLDPKTREVVSPDIREQTRQTLTNLKSILAAAGLTMASVVNMRVTLRNTEDFPAFNETFREFLAGEKVTRTCVGATPHRKGVNVEIDCVAVFD